MSRAAWVVVAASGVICAALALSPGPAANAEGEDDWFSPATSTSITTAPSTTTSTTTSTTSTTVASTTTTEDEWLPPATVTSTTSTTRAPSTTTTGSSTTTTKPGGGTRTDPDPGTSSTTSTGSSTSTTAACYFENAAGEKEPALPEDCEAPVNQPDPTVTTVTTPSVAPTTPTAPATNTLPLVDPSTTVAPSPGPTGSLPPATDPLGNDQTAAGAPTTTTGTIPPGDVDLDQPEAARSASVREITFEPSTDAQGGLVERSIAGAFAPAAQASAGDSPSFVFSFPWDRQNPIGVELGPGRVLGAWVIWMTITLLIMAFWVPSPTRRVSRVTVRRARAATRRG